MHLRLLPLALLASVSIASAQQQTIPGYSPGSAERQRAVEADAIQRRSPEHAERHARELASAPHVAGTAGQARTRDYVLDQTRAWGLETEADEYEVWMPHPTSVGVWRIMSDPLELELQEPPVPGDSVTLMPQYPPVNGYSAAGDVSGEVAYVNYGLIEDYAVLDSLGVSVEGKIAVARYGRSFRGIKAREAEKHGAVALILYSDPADDGYFRGDVYPEGPMRPAQGLQRGSVMNGAGDPSTPGWPSIGGSERLRPGEMEVPRIPVVPVSHASAAELLEGLRGTPIPQEWQGALPFRYHIGPGPVAARVAVTNDASPYKTIWNTYATIRGSEFPHEVIVIGAHRDAWGAGAVDNVSGTVSVLGAARIVAEQVRAGMRPRRTLVFATWDAEEWGLIGSTEYVERDSLRLLEGGVAYLNQDGVVSGSRFGAGGSPSLRSTLRDVLHGVPHPGGEGSVYEAWRHSAGVVDSLEPPMGDPGGGSDFAGFYNHFGIPHADWGFGGPYGVYHSAYDTPQWMEEFGDPDFTRHATVAAITAAMALRLANADILPYDYVEFTRTLRGKVGEIEAGFEKQAWDGMSADPLRQAIDRMEQAAAEFARARDAALAEGTPSQSMLERTNQALLGIERALTRPQGLRGRPWYRNLIYASDRDNGYSTIVFPSVQEAIRDRDRELAARELADLVAHFDAATAKLVEAREALER